MRIAIATLIAAIAAANTLAAAPAAPPPQTSVKAVLELNQPVYYAGDPLRIRVSVLNSGEREIPNPVKTPILSAFDVRVAGGATVKAEGKSSSQEPTRPDRLAPGSFYGTIVDLAEIYPELRKTGRYEIRWSADGVSSDTIVVTMIPKYDPSKEYRAAIETDEGAFVIEFNRKTAPLATKSFIDMANAGFYDGLTFHEVHPDWFVIGGDPQGDGTGSPPLRYPADPSSIPVVAGTVLMKPLSPSPPTNGSQFMVMLRAEPAWTGQATVLGQVVEGIEVVKKIASQPSTEQSARPYFRPLKDIHIRKVKVTEKVPATTR